MDNRLLGKTPKRQPLRPLPGTVPITTPQARPARATSGLQPLPAGSFAVVNNAPAVTQAAFNAMQAVIAILAAAKPNVVPNSQLYRQMDATLLEQGQTSLVQALAVLQTVGAVKFCELTQTWYLPFTGSQPLNQLVTILPAT